MTPKKRILAVVLTLALGMGVWTLAFTYQTASFADGDVLSASQLNTLLNDNFQAASDAVDAVDAAKVDRAGDTMSGRLNVDAAATSSGTGDPTTTFRVDNTGSDGSAAVFHADNGSDNGVVSIKQDGAGPALSLKSNGGGPLIVGAGELVVSFAVDADGSIRIGDMGTDGTGDPTLHLDATDGTITNAVGSGLPLAFGTVTSGGSVEAGSTSNWTVTQEAGPIYRIAIDGASYLYSDYATTVTPIGSAARTATAGSQGGDLLVRIFDENGNQVAEDFTFVTYEPGS